MTTENEDEINCIMKTKGPFYENSVMNETIKHPLFKPNFNIESFFLLILDFSISLLFSKHNFP
jgi:hypothetical protein